MTVEQALRSLLGQRILLLDGAMGTMIQQERLDEGDFRGDRWAGHDRDLKGNNELLCVTRPDLIRGIHERYLAAGVDIIATNTFGATSIAQEDYGLPEIARELNLAAARIAREACDRFATPQQPRFVAGAIGPTPRTASISPDVADPGARNVTFDALRQAYEEQARALLDGGRRRFSGRNHFRYLEREGGDLRHRDLARRAPGAGFAAGSGDDFGHGD